MGETDGVCVSRLIALVRERPVLWDRQEEVYKNRKLTKKAWAEICEELLDNYSELSEEDQKAFARSVIGKWANLRDNWLRYWRKRQDYLRVGSCNSKFKKYIHHEQLMFLSKVYDDQSEMQQEVEEIQVEVDVLSDPGTESPQGFSSEDVSQTPWSLGVSSEEDVLAQRAPWIPEEKPPPPPLPPLAEERHLYFFQSTLPLIADFDENQVLDFHAAVLESIKRVKTGKNVVNIVSAPQPAYILAIAQPQGFLANTAEVKPKMLPDINTSKQSSNALEESAPTKNSVSNCLLNVSNLGQQNPSSTKHISEEDKPEHEGTNSAQLSSTKRQNLAGLELTDLKSVVNKLDEISQKFESSPFEDSHDKFGKYIGSFLRTLPLKKARLLKRRIVRQVIRVQLSDKINRTHFDKAEETIIKNKPLNTEPFPKPQRTSENDIENRSLSLEETVRTNSPVRNLYLNTNEIHSKIQCAGTPTNHTKSNGNPVDDCQTSPLDIAPHRFNCHVCSCICVSSAELQSHCSTQHKGYSPSFKSKAEPAKRGRRGRKKKIFNNAEVIS